jgi:hypothetical protein
LAKQRGVKKKDLSPERIAEWTRVLDARNFDPLLRLQQVEIRRVYDGLGMTHIQAFEGSQDDPGAAITRLASKSASPHNVPQRNRAAYDTCVTFAVEDPGETGDDDESGEFELF